MNIVAADRRYLYLGSLQCEQYCQFVAISTVSAFEILRTNRSSFTQFRYLNQLLPRVTVVFVRLWISETVQLFTLMASKLVGRSRSSTAQGKECHTHCMTWHDLWSSAVFFVSRNSFTKLQLDCRWFDWLSLSFLTGNSFTGRSQQAAVFAELLLLSVRKHCQRHCKDSGETKTNYVWAACNLWKTIWYLRSKATIGYSFHHLKLFKKKSSRTRLSPKRVVQTKTAPILLELQQLLGISLASW